MFPLKICSSTRGKKMSLSGGGEGGRRGRQEREKEGRKVGKEGGTRKKGKTRKKEKKGKKEQWEGGREREREQVRANLGLKPRREEGGGGAESRQAAGPGLLLFACLPATGLEADEILEQTCGFMLWSLVDEPNK